MNASTALNALLDWYATLTPAAVAYVPRLYTPQARFRDPFNDVHGHAAIQAIFAHMFATTEQPRFVIRDHQQAGSQAFVTWDCHFRLRGREFHIDGASHLHFADDGRVHTHRDYWDAAETVLARLPLAGPMVEWLRRQFRVQLTQD